MRSQRTLAMAVAILAMALVPGAAWAQPGQLTTTPGIAPDEIVPADVEALPALEMPSVCGTLAGRPSADPGRPALADGLSTLLQPLHLLCGQYAIAQGPPTSCGPVDEAAVGAGAPGPFAGLIGVLMELESAAAELGAPGGVAGQVAEAVGGCEYAPAETSPMADTAPPPPPPPLGSTSLGSGPSASSVASQTTTTGSSTSSVPTGGAAAGGTAPAPRPGAVTIEAPAEAPAEIAAAPAAAFFPQAPFSTPEARSALVRTAAAVLPLLALGAAGLLGGGLTRGRRDVGDPSAA